MKKIIKIPMIIMFLVLISIGIQTGVLYYINNYYLADNTKIEYKQVVKKIPKADESKLMVEENSTNFKLSPSGKYCVYNVNGELSVINMTDGSKDIVKLDNSLDSYFVKWHDTEDSLILISNIKEENAIKVYRYNPKEKALQQALDYNNAAREYDLYTSNSKVVDMQLNIMNTIIYLKTASNENINSLMRLDISGGISKLPIDTKSIGKFFVIKQKDETIYENMSNNSVELFDGYSKKQLNLDKNKEYKLLYTDQKDNVYIGEIGNNNKIVSILKANLDQDTNDIQWNSIKLSNEEIESDLCITTQGSIYNRDEQKEKILNIENSKETSYKGDFLDMNDDEIISLVNNNIIIQKLNK